MLFIVTVGVEEKMESFQDSEEDQASATGDSENEESSSVGTKTDGELMREFTAQLSTPAIYHVA